MAIGKKSLKEKMAGALRDWSVPRLVRETFENETASYWYKSPEALSGKLRPEEVKTEIFLLPAAIAGEKDGTFTNTHRLIQWHDKVVDPPADCRSDLWFIYHLGKKLKELYAESADPRDDPIKNLNWDYPEAGPNRDPSAEAVLKEINGYTWKDRKQLRNTKAIKDDGSTACGVWIYAGIFPGEGQNQSRSRKPDPPEGPGTHLGWGFAWPDNRRILYNRASADPDGKPWSEKKRYIWWDESQEKWTGLDVPDFPPDKAPGYACGI